MDSSKAEPVSRLYQVIASLFFLLTLFVAARVLAQQPQDRCHDASGTYGERIRYYETDDCYQGVESYKSLEKNVAEVLVVPENYRQVSENSLQALYIAMAGAQGMVSELSDKHALALLSDYISSAEASYNELADHSDKGIPLKDSKKWVEHIWKPGDINDGAQWDQVHKYIEESECRDKYENDACELTFQEIIKVTSFVYVMNEITDYYLDLARDGYIQALNLRAKQWNSYVNDVQFQYPWELSANFCWNNPRIKWESQVKRLVCFLPFVNTGVALRKASEYPDGAWENPPNYRMIFLHPDVGIAYTGDEPDGSKVNAALVFEWVGFLRWSDYNDEGRIHNPWGLSVVSTYADLAVDKDVGWGLMGHYKKFGLSVSKHGQDTMFFLNLNLMDFLQDPKNEQSKRLKEVFETIRPSEG